MPHPQFVKAVGLGWFSRFGVDRFRKLKKSSESVFAWCLRTYPHVNCLPFMGAQLPTWTHSWTIDWMRRSSWNLHNPQPITGVIEIHDFLLAGNLNKLTLLGTNISPPKMFEDDFPFPKMGYVSFLEGNHQFLNPCISTRVSCTWDVWRPSKAHTKQILWWSIECGILWKVGRLEVNEPKLPVVQQNKLKKPPFCIIMDVVFLGQRMEKGSLSLLCHFE